MIPSRRSLGPAVVLLLGLGIVYWRLDVPAPTWVERVYAQGLYPPLAAVIVPLTGSVPLSVAGLLLVLSPFALAGSLVWSFRRRDSTVLWLWAWVWRLAACAIVLYALFVVVWGANYAREPIETLLDLGVSPVSQLEVLDLADGLLEVIRDDAPRPAGRDEDVAFASLRRSLAQVVEQTTGVRPTLPSRLKRLPPGTLLTFGNAGVISPWTLEPHIDGALPGPSKLAVGTHELAHIAGFAGEADADLMAAIAGLQADDPYARYSTALRLFSQLSAQLPREVFQSLYDRLPDEAKSDLAAMRQTAARYMSQRAVRLVQGAYDRYLKSQGVEAGLSDYSRTITLLTRAWQQGRVAVGGRPATKRRASAP